MADARPRKADLQRWRREIVDHLEDFPRQYAALESAMAAFGEDFDLDRFRQAYETRTEMQDYNRAQAVERALGRVQNFVADLAIAGAKLADLRVAEGGNDGDAQRAFTALREASVIDAGLCRRLKAAQKARATIEHSYVTVPAGNVHRGAELIRDCARSFIGPYRAWIEGFVR